AGVVRGLDRRSERVLERLAFLLDRAAVVARRLDFRHRRVVRHEDRGGNALLARGPGDGLAVVPGARGDDARRAFLLGQASDLVDGAADLEGAGPLEVLRLEMDGPIRPARERLRSVHRRYARDSLDPRAR